MCLSNWTLCSYVQLRQQSSTIFKSKLELRIFRICCLNQYLWCIPLSLQVQETKTFHSGKHYPAVNRYLTKNSGQYFKSRQVAIVPFRCEECGGDFESISDLVLHFRTHFNGSHYECSVCLATFSSNQMLKKHMERHDGKEGRISHKGRTGK